MLTPEQILSQEFDQAGRAFQQRVEQEWKEVTDNAELYGPEQTLQRLDQLKSKHTSEFAKIKQGHSRKMNSLNEINQLAQHGLIDDADELKWKMVLGPETERAMFKNAKSIPDRYGELDIYRNRLESRMNQFEPDPGGSRIKDPFKWWFQESKSRPMLKVYSHTVGTGKDAKEIFRPAKQEEQKEYAGLVAELERTKQMQNTLMQEPNMTNRMRQAAAKSNRLGVGTIETSISSDLESRKPKVNDTLNQPTTVRVKAPDGSTGSIPIEDWDEAQRSGYTRVQ